MTRLLFFGRLRDVAGGSERSLALPPEIGTVRELRAWIGADHVALAEALNAGAVRVAIDQVMCVDDDASVRGAVEIAFMPPLSGG
ncbi:MAG: MoaD/ThiS family protein [Hyphomonadaceae bacterium]